ncbi:ABC transporter ATP-binding protein [uncultured Clostridium sp.]|jgi:ABC transporter, ATP-binding protein|uniref:ABC transporter ATP-binding protein n=1 Tax=uncultured Clostridium sp. TaxID=59620 RepID=UPI0025FDE145|nr:ATP-binding cassette domain-containing protein [uncultured Clostridium sp.]
MSYLMIKNVNKMFNKIKVLNGIDIEINKGEFISFLGPSGCGKTTLLRIIAGLEKLDTGNIIIDGVDVTNFPPSKRKIGIVFQSYVLFPNLNVYENIAYGLRNKKIRKNEIDSKVNNILELVGLKEFVNKYPFELSGGQQQRVALARSLVLKPDILLLDEPLSALDAKVRENLRDEIKLLQRKLNITTIMVTHDQEEAIIISDKIIVFNYGNIMQLGTPREIYYHPQNSFTADFVGKINYLKNTKSGRKFVRPECIEFSSEPMSGYSEVIVKDIEFRGNIYRVLVDNNGENIYLDLQWKEIIKKKILLGSKLYINLNIEGSIIEKEVAAHAEGY